MSRDNTSETMWGIRDVPELTRRKVKMYAASCGLAIGQAIQEMTEQSGPSAERRALAQHVGRLAVGITEEAARVPDKMWLVKDVPADTRRAVKVRAVLYDLSIAQALTQMVDGYLREGASDQSGTTDMAPFEAPIQDEPKHS